MSDFAPYNSRLGQLQRGRGAGFLQALRAPTAARGDLLRCISRDPRIEPQLESRARYYAELALRLDVSAEAIATLARGRTNPMLQAEVLAEMAARGSDGAMRILRDPDRAPELSGGMVEYLRDYPEFAHAHLPFAAVASYAQRLGDADELIDDVDIYEEFWAPYAARLPQVANAFAESAARQALEDTQLPEPLAQPDAVSTAALLDYLEQQASSVVVAELQHRTSAEDRALLAWRAEHDGSSMRMHAAAQALGSMGDPRLLELAESWFLRPDDLTDRDNMMSPQDRQRRIALLSYFVALPPALTLPLARAWWQRGGYLRGAAGRVLAEHAEPIDRHWLEASAWQGLLGDDPLAVLAELTALQHIGDRDSLPLYLAIAARTTSAFVRSRALHGAAPFAGEVRAQVALHEALWDCEAEARQLGCEHARLGDATSRQRLGELAGDLLEEHDARTAAQARLAG